MKKEFKVDGMSCSHCAMAVEKNLSNLQLKNVDVKIGSVTVDFDESVIKVEDIVKSIEEAGYNVVEYN